MSTTENEDANFPANPVEETLGQALAQAREEGASEEGADAETISTFIAALREGSLWVPLPEGSGAQEDGSVSLPTLELEGAPFVPVFTSEGQLSARGEELPFTIITTRDLAGALPEGVGLTLNPGNDASVPIYPQTVSTLTNA